MTSASGRNSGTEDLIPDPSGGGISRPTASYSPLGAADSGYHTDSPQPLASSFEAAARSAPTSALSHLREATPPPGTFRPVSPQPSLLGRNTVDGGTRHVATQTFQLQHRPHHADHFNTPFQPQAPPLFRSQLSTGFRPASVPLYDSPDNDGGVRVGAVAEGAVGGTIASVGGLLDNDNADLEEDFDEEVYRSSAAIGGGGQPLPDLLQLRHHNDEAAARHRSRSVPVTDESARQERVALLLREIGDQYNQSRVSPASLFQATWRIGGGQRSRDRRISLRLDPPSTDDQGGDWSGSIIGWVAKMARTLSGADIARENEEDEEEERRSGEDDEGS